MTFSFKAAWQRLRNLAQASKKPPLELGSAELDQRIRDIVGGMVLPTLPGGQPNINLVWMQTRDLDLMRLNIKYFGYELGHAMLNRLEKAPLTELPAIMGLQSKPSTQADVESYWFSYWCAQIGTAPLYHRKLWEFAFALQALHEAGLLVAGKRGIGFGCGEEPLPSYFAKLGMHVVATDLASEQAIGRGWMETGQHASSLDQAYKPHIVERDVFNRQVRHTHVDMNDLSVVQEKFDFCWSICALEHLGSIEKGLTFIERSLDCLEPGGIAIHTTEFNFLAGPYVLDNWPTVLFQRQHFEELIRRLRAAGHEVLGPDFDVGDEPLDRFIDLPPFSHTGGRQSSRAETHLKLSIDGFACTCFGLIIRKASAA